MERIHEGDRVVYNGVDNIISKDIIGTVKRKINDVCIVEFEHYTFKCFTSNLKLYVPVTKNLKEVTISVDDFKVIKATILDMDYLKEKLPNFDTTDLSMLIASGEVILKYFKKELFRGD